MNALADPRVAPGILSPLGPIVFIFMQYSGKKGSNYNVDPLGAIWEIMDSPIKCTFYDRKREVTGQSSARKVEVPLYLQ